MADPDNDGISDGIEVLGKTGLNLIGMGARPSKKDLLVEIDWLSGAACTITPTSASVNPLKAAFAAAPNIDNPNGTGGINLIVDYGQGGLFTGGSQVTDVNGDGQIAVGQHDTLKVTAFAQNRRRIFHWSLGFYGGALPSTGESPGDDVNVSFPCSNTGPRAGRLVRGGVDARAGPQPLAQPRTAPRSAAPAGPTGGRTTSHW